MTSSPTVSHCQYGSESHALEVAGCEWHYALLVVQARNILQVSYPELRHDDDAAVSSVSAAKGNTQAQHKRRSLLNSELQASVLL